jgi:hypothetical protein
MCILRRRVLSSRLLPAALLRCRDILKLSRPNPKALRLSPRKKHLRENPRPANVVAKKAAKLKRAEKKRLNRKRPKRLLLKKLKRLLLLRLLPKRPARMELENFPPEGWRFVFLRLLRLNRSGGLKYLTGRLSMFVLRSCPAFLRLERPRVNLEFFLFLAS